MKTILAMALLVGVVLSSEAQQVFGIGLMLGPLSGVSFKSSASPSSSADLLFAGGPNDSFFSQGHYNFTILTIAQSDDNEVNLYGGPGIYLRFPTQRKAIFGFSGDFGIGWIFKKNVEFFSELSPKMGLMDQTKFDMTGGIGFRFLF
jgi:hypothetical protein